MALQQRRVINQVEVQTNGDLQVRYADEIYDDSITVVVGVGKVGDADYAEAVTDVVAEPKYIREVIAKSTTTPSAVQTYLDASKA